MGAEVFAFAPLQNEETGMKRWQLGRSVPATKWTDGAPLGNGRIGAMVYGRISDERILLNHEALFEREPGDERVPDLRDKLEQVRTLLHAGKYAQANDVYPNAFSAACNPPKVFFYPAADLRILTATESAYTDYENLLDLRDGVHTLSWRSGNRLFVRESFAVQGENVLLCKLSCEGVARFTLGICPHNNRYGEAFPQYATEPLPHFEWESGSDRIVARCQTPAGQRYAVCMQVHALHGNVYEGGGVADLAHTLIAEGSSFLVAAEVVVGDETFRFELPEDEKNYRELRSKSCRDFSKKFDRVKLSLGTRTKRTTEELLLTLSRRGAAGAPTESLRLTELMAGFGRYLFLSSSVGGKLPSNLQGIWNGSYDPPFRCLFFQNENIQMNYWQALPGNLPEAMLPFFSLYERLLPDFRENAEKLFGCRGILIPVYCDDRSGKQVDMQAHTLYWTAGAGWIASFFYQYYLWTGDEVFAKERAFPFLREVGRFYEDFLSTDTNGNLCFAPANSPENCALGNFEGAGRVPVCFNPTMDVAVAREVFTNLITLSEYFFPEQKEERKYWNRLLSELPAYRIGREGELREWLTEGLEDNHEHRHLSHLYPFFPGNEIDSIRTPELFAAVGRTVELRSQIGLESQTGWSFAHLANLFAKYGAAENAYDCLCNIIQFCTGNNLLTYHNDWRGMGVTMQFSTELAPPFQIDAGLGFTAAFYGMLLQSQPDALTVFAALPTEWKRGTVSGLRGAGGVRADLRWEKGNAVCLLTGSASRKFCLRWGKTLAPLWTSEETCQIEVKPGQPLKLCFVRKDK